jgi:glycosyltransferase involved in cell wall biosynthesis
MSALVTVIIPTHSHAETLEYSVRSVLNQTISEIRAVIVGDGATDDVRAVALGLCQIDNRVEFHDHPKTLRRGEIHRDSIIRNSDSQFIAYNCDDDLWFSDHLESLINIIEDRDFAHPLPILIGVDGVPFFMPSDLSRPDSVQWHLSETPRNTISLSGVMHTRRAYLKLPFGWRETPIGRWTDHYMWQQFFEQEWFTGITSTRATTLKLMAQGRDDFAPGERRKDIESWWTRLQSPEFAGYWENLVQQAVRKSAIDYMLLSTRYEDEIIHLRKCIGNLEEARDGQATLLHNKDSELLQVNNDALELRKELTACRNKIEVFRLRLSRVQDQLDGVHRSRSWRITKPLRTIRSWLR